MTGGGVGCPAERVLLERSRRIPDDTAWQAFGVTPCMSREHRELSPGWGLLVYTVQWKTVCRQSAHGKFYYQDLTNQLC